MELASRFTISAMPTFCFFLKKSDVGSKSEKVDQLIGANMAKLESIITRLIEDAA